jgi:hypothetical protein
MYGYTPGSTTYTAQLALVGEQITAATKGQFLATYNTITHPGSFWNAPATVGAANLLAAYWLAVAARLGYTSLLPAANRFYQTARAASSSGSADARKSVLQSAVASLDQSGAKADKRLAPIYVVLGGGQSSDRLALADQLAYDQSTRGKIVGAAGATLKTVGSGLETGGRLLTGQRPPETPPWLWWLQRNAFWLGVGAVTLGVGYVYLRPVLAPLTRVRDAAASASQRMADKAVARISSNPRRNRSRR